MFTLLLKGDKIKKMKITTDIRTYISREVNNRIFNRRERIFNGLTSEMHCLPCPLTDEIKSILKESAIKDVKEKFKVSDEIIKKSDISITVIYDIHYKDAYDSINEDKLVEQVIIEMQLNPAKFKSISDIDILIDEIIEKNKKEN